MGITRIDKDPDALTLTVIADYDVPVERAWQLWADPRQLERWWGPPGYPATVVDHDLSVGGDVRYYMTSPEGDKYHGYWRVIAVEAHRSLQVLDGFSHDDGTPNDDMPTTTMHLSLTGRDDGGTTVSIVSSFATLEHLEQLVEMGMLEGLQAAMGQIDDILAG